MKYDEEKWKYILESGKELIIDQILLPKKNYAFTRRIEFGLGSFLDEVTAEERKEIAEYMIELWRAWAE